jgi:hypothetical protein
MESELDRLISGLATAETQQSANRVLASIFRLLFDRNLEQPEWGRLGKLCKVYGKWRVLDSFLSASNTENFVAGVYGSDSKIWNYFSAVCLSMVNEEIAYQKQLQQRIATQEDTLEIIRELSQTPAILELKDTEWLTSNKD